MICKIIYGDSVIQYNLIKSKRIKTSQITVTPEGVTVRTPQTKTTADIKAMVRARLQWIAKKQLYFSRQKKPSYSVKSTLPFQGKEYRILIIPTGAQKTSIVGNTIVFHTSQKRHTVGDIKKQYQTYLQKRADVLFPKMVQELARKVGTVPTKINIKQLKSRWGSATVAGEINLNYALIKAPRSVIKYVILHELCHFKIKEHSHHFWNLVAQHMSEYEESMKWLESNGIRIN